MNLLIVDDEAILRMSLDRAAKLRGHNVKTASDGRAALEILKDFLADVILLDVMMPVLSGPEFLKELPDAYPGVVVLMSAYSGDFRFDSTTNNRSSLFIRKPFDSVFEVISKVEEFHESTKH